MSQGKRVGRRSSTGETGTWGKGCKRLLSDLSPSVVMREACRKPAEQGTTTLAKFTVKVFIDSTANVLLLECHLNLIRSTEWW